MSCHSNKYWKTMCLYFMQGLGRNISHPSIFLLLFYADTNCRCASCLVLQTEGVELLWYCTRLVHKLGPLATFRERKCSWPVGRKGFMLYVCIQRHLLHTINSSYWTHLHFFTGIRVFEMGSHNLSLQLSHLHNWTKIWKIQYLRYSGIWWFYSLLLLNMKQ